jgi:hypothetical protein
MSTGHAHRIAFLLLLLSLPALAQTQHGWSAVDPSLPARGFASQLAELGVANTYFIYLGTSVAIGGNTVAVGTPFAGNSTNTAFVYVKPRSGWDNMSQTALLVPSDGGDEFQNFGGSIAMSSDGSTVIVGASQYDESLGTSIGPGKVYVFLRPPGGWSGQIEESAQLTASDGVTGDALGASVCIDGNTIIAGAPGTPPYSQPGSAYVFVEPAGGWKTSTQTAKLTTSPGASRVGTSVSISGSAAAVGSPYYDDGSVDVFVEPPGGWVDMTQTAELTSAGEISGGLMGSSVTIDGSIVAAGGPSANVGSNQYEGAVYIFAQPPSGWRNMTQTATLTEPTGKAGDGFGTALAMSSGTLVVGSPYYWRGPISNRGFDSYVDEGAAYAFTKTGGGWGYSAMHGADARYDALLGSAVGIDGRSVAVGAPYLGHEAGSVYIFELQ